MAKQTKCDDCGRITEVEGLYNDTPPAWLHSFITPDEEADTPMLVIDLCPECINSNEYEIVADMLRLHKAKLAELDARNAK